MISWRILIHKVLKNPPHKDALIPKHIVKDPLEEGFFETLGEPQGQMKDYELTLSDGRRIHVREFKDHYKVHWDKMSPRINPIDHLRYDAPHWWILILFGVGALAEYLVSKNINKALEKGLILSLIGMVTIPGE